MARRRKKTSKPKPPKNANTEKSLPAIPPPEARLTTYIPQTAELESPPMPVPEPPSVSSTMRDLRGDVDSDNSRPPTGHQAATADSLTLPSTTYRNNRHSYVSQRSDLSGPGGEEFLIPLAFDPNPPKQASSQQSTPQVRQVEERPKDYFLADRSQSQQGSQSQTATPNITQSRPDHLRKQSDATPSRQGSATTSPHIHEPHQSPHISQLARNDSAKSENFKLQEAPQKRRMPSQSSTPRQDLTPNLREQRSPDMREQKDIREQKPPSGRTTPRLSYETSPDFTDGFNSPPQPPPTRDIPKRGDSLGTNQNAVPRKPVEKAVVSSPLNDMSNTPGPKQPPMPADQDKANGGKVISAPISSPGSQSIYDTPGISQGETPVPSEKFVQPRAPPAPPSSHARNESISTLQSDAQRSPKLPRYSGGGDFTLEEDISRILGLENEPNANESFLRRVSNSVRHGRTMSDRSGRFSRDRWPRSPIVPGAAGQEISSPSTSSPEHREELAWFKNELRRERQKTLEREKKIAELEAQMNAAADISQVNVELKEKRSTMVVLDTQKEIVVRELEVLTEHIANAKRNGEPLDMNKMNSLVLRDLAEGLEKLKSSFTPQIESLVQKKNDLTEEISKLNEQKDKSFNEFEQLSIKNAQLAEFNNQLVDQIQNIYKSNRGMEEIPKPNGLGIYSHHKDVSKTSIDRDMPKQDRPPVNDPGTMYEAGEAGTIHSMGGAQVVDLKKGAVAKRFDWRKGQKMAKGLTKGVKGAFASAQQNYGRDMHFAETGAYGNNLTAGQEPYSMPRNNSDTKQQWLQRPQGKNGLYANSNNASTPSLLADQPVTLFGTDLEIRADFEKTTIPGIVKRCIAEVEARGMDVEGIYRKSGGNSQVQQVKEGFEKQPFDYDISDPDLDIHAVTSGLKQYFRKLPTPLITYEVYDLLIELSKIPEGPNQHAERIDGLREALSELPPVHFEILEYLMGHLARVVVLEKENLMTPMNVAVVFAPTIMRPESVARELSDTKAKNEVVMWMVQDVEAVFRKG